MADLSFIRKVKLIRRITDHKFIRRMVDPKVSRKMADRNKVTRLITDRIRIDLKITHLITDPFKAFNQITDLNRTRLILDPNLINKITAKNPKITEDCHNLNNTTIKLKDRLIKIMLKVAPTETPIITTSNSKNIPMISKTTVDYLRRVFLNKTTRINTDVSNQIREMILKIWKIDSLLTKVKTTGGGYH